MITTAVILAAGRGSRLKEVTATRSKAMAPVAGKPIIARVIDELSAAGISDCVVVAAPHDEELVRFCALHGHSVVIQEKPLGSADALKGCKVHVSGDFLVCACDSIVPAADIRSLVATHVAGASATLSVIEVEPTVSLAARSVVAIEGERVADIIEKPSASERISNVSSLPLYVFSQDIFAEIALLEPSLRGEYEIPEALRRLIRSGKLVRFCVAAERRDLTDQSDLLALNEHYLNLLAPAIQVHPSVVLPSSVKLVPPVLIEEGVSIGEMAVLGPAVYLERCVSVGAGCSLRRSVITRGSIVTQDVERCVIVSQGS
jgi:dTDP-glucose pyrophosphorylase